MGKRGPNNTDGSTAYRKRQKIVHEIPAGEDIASADVRLRMKAPEELGALLYGKQPIALWAAGEGRAAEGDMELAQRFIDLFALPEKVG